MTWLSAVGTAINGLANTNVLSPASQKAVLVFLVAWKNSDWSWGVPLHSKRDSQSMVLAFD